MVRQITLYTSIPPKISRLIAHEEFGPSYQLECIKSWNRAGFNVVSLNSDSEMEQLASFGYDIRYVPISGNRPKITDFLDAIRESREKIAGIINADCYLAGDADLISTVKHHAAEGVVVIERLNIDPLTLRPTGRSRYGFDAFLFTAEAISSIDMDRELTIGETWWDFWFPVACCAAGAKLMTVGAPLLFHLDHVQKYQTSQWLANGRRFVCKFLTSPGKLPENFLAELRRFSGMTAISEGDLASFSDRCFAWLRWRSESIKLPLKQTEGNPLSCLISSLNDPETRAEAYARPLVERLAITEYHLALTKEAHTLATTHAEYLEKQLATLEKHLVLLKECHTYAESHARHLEKQLAAAQQQIAELSQSLRWVIMQKLRRILRGVT